MAWGHTGSPTWLRKARQTLSARKLMVTVFWDAQGILLIEFMTRGTTINSQVYCRTLKKLKRAIPNKRRGLLSSGVVLLHDNVRPHTAVGAGAVLRKLKWDVFQHPPYSSDLAPSDFHLTVLIFCKIAGGRFLCRRNW
ncbi:Mariner Mos1 transposase [Araneus ventricosus]|uniref:Mariner Mos1 transposase n=1 Tax=Araneus ventricosus TaxID=182803 RepID=A0A4Y2H9S1_ARAVE|nr:Mariner Mos1 transposase [Araneus ventricosus]